MHEQLCFAVTANPVAAGGLHQAPFLSQGPFSGQEGDQQDEQGPGVAGRVGQLPLGLNLDVHLGWLVPQLFEQSGQLLGRDQPTAGLLGPAPEATRNQYGVKNPWGGCRRRSTWSSWLLPGTWRSWLLLGRLFRLLSLLFDLLQFIKRLVEMFIDGLRQRCPDAVVLEFGFRFGHSVFVRDLAGVRQNVSIAQAEEVVELLVQSAMYIGRRFNACNSANSRYAVTMRFSTLSSSAFR